MLFDKRSKADVFGPAKSLEAETGIDPGYSRCGGLELRLGTDSDELSDEIRTWRNEEVRVEELSPHEVRLAQRLRESNESLPYRKLVKSAKAEEQRIWIGTSQCASIDGENFNTQGRRQVFRLS